MKLLRFLVLGGSALIVGCHDSSSITIGGACVASEECGAQAVCLLGTCVADDFFSVGSQEGEPNGGGGTAVILDSDCYQLPLETYQITGYHHGSAVGGGLVHAGDDCNGDAGTPVRAIYDGTVFYAAHISTWGGLIEIEHKNPVDGSTFYSLYGHMNVGTFKVAEGQQVAAGDLLGELGTKAQNGGWPEHLHFSIFTGSPPPSRVLPGHVASLAGFQDPIPWLTDNCVACKCDGVIDAAALVDEQLKISGSIACEGGIDKWSIVVHDKTVHGGFSNDSAPVMFSEIVDLSGYGFADSDAPIGLWARAVEAEACLVDDTVVSPMTGGDCVAEGDTACADDNVVSVDSCGNQLQTAEACVAPSVCVADGSDAQCKVPAKDCGDGELGPGEACDGANLGGATCKGEGYSAGALACNGVCALDTSGCCAAQDVYQCNGGDVYWFDSCGHLGELKESCEAGKACVEPSGSTATCSAACGNGTIDPDEACDGDDLGGKQCADFGFDGGSLSCTSGCKLDDSDCSACTIEVTSMSLGAWTPSFAPQVDCSCNAQHPDCYALYQGRVDSIAGNTAQMAFQKKGGGAPKKSVDYWVVVGAAEMPACFDLDSYVERDSGTWSPGEDPLEVDVPVWPSQAAFEAAPAGETKRLFVISGDGAGDIHKRTWYQPQSIEFTKVCD